MASKSYSPSAYSVQLLQKLLSLRDDVSPLTLVLDSVQEPGTIVLEEFMLRAKAAGTRVLYASSFLAGPRKSPHVDIWVERQNKSLAAFRDDILAQAAKGGPQKMLIVVDSLCQLARIEPLFVAAFVSGLVSPTAAVLGLYHADEDPPPAAAARYSKNPRLAFGKPPPLRVLCHLATAIIRVHALHEEVSRKRARDRCEEEPRFGWAEGEGSLFGHADSRFAKQDVLGGNNNNGILVSMELRRRSGRAVVERFVVVWDKPMPWEAKAASCSDITVMGDHALFAGPPDLGAGSHKEEEEVMPATTFSLGLTEKQRRDREGVVLPYFDAQTDIGAGEGGRILYDMGREDDFDDEEDEI